MLAPCRPYLIYFACILQPPSMSGESLGGETYTSEMNPKLKGKQVPTLALETIEDEYCAPPYTHDAAEDVSPTTFCPRRAAVKQRVQRSLCLSSSRCHCQPTAGQTL